MTKSYEIRAYRGRLDNDPLVIRTDTSERAAELAAALNAREDYAYVTVNIGHQRFNYSDFIKQLEKTT